MATRQPGNPATASIVAIGSEMLGPTRVDTNSLKITAALEDFGVEVARKSVVGDRLRDLADEIRYCAERVRAGTSTSETELVIESLEMYLFPQFEGQDKKHNKIIDTISVSLGLPDDLKRRVHKRLALWTGFEKGS